jgi:Flp pilus assembly protein TadD
MQLGQTTASAPQDSLPIAATENHSADARRDVDVYGQQYRTDPTNLEKAMRYAQALRRAGQRAQAVAVLEKASIENPRNKAVLGAYGRALAEAGNYEQALEVLDRAHTPDQPDWHILSAEGAVLDQMGRHADAQRYYLTALKIVPDEPSVLSNLGLSYALSKNLREAEATLRRAAAQHPVDSRVR